MARPSRTPRARSMTSVVVALLVVVAAVDVLAIRSIVASRDNALAAAEADVADRVALDARTLESTLAAARADLEVLATTLGEVAPVGDPVADRRRRLARESALLLFAASHPVLDELRLVGADGAAEVRVARKGSEPAVVAAAGGSPSAPFEVELPTPDGLRLIAGAGTGGLGLSDPGFDLELVPPGRTVPLATSEVLVAVAPVALVGWNHQQGWRLVRREARQSLLADVEELVASSQRALLLNLLLIPTSLGLGLVAVSGIRKAERLASEREAADERRELERRLWHAERLASVGRLAAGIAHEINNPLAGTTSWLVLLEEDVANGDTDRARSSAAKVRHGLERIRDVVRRTLTFADPGQAGASAVDLAAVVAETAAFVGDLEKDCVLEVAAAGPTIVLGDRAALGQLILNLLLNAVTIQGPGGRVAIAVATDQEDAVVTVDDTGPGIAPEVLERLFEPFVSGRGSTGLGLAVCHGIVAAHGGSITGENRPHKGARFVVRLPLEGQHS